ncbi:MAG: FtsQ-type POTRA domain-containing protein, partial [Oscillospiraceae bacterium]|nr:FtsQ-type POTRA domain-containing protein [Oscillospiraceae bacterium]
MAKKPTKTKAKKNKNAKPRGGLRAARRVLGALAVLIALTVLCTLSLTIWFPVKSSVWEGPSRYTDKQLTAVVEKSIGQRNIFRADLKALAAKLPAELPYVKSARVTRRLPGTLLVTMEECVPMLAQKQGEHWGRRDET